MDKLLPLSITESNKTYPTIKNAQGMIGSVLNIENAKYIVKAANEYPELKNRILELEIENKRLREAIGNGR